MARRKKTHVDYIKAALRKIWRWDGERRRALKRAFLYERYGTEYYRCEECDTQPIPRKDKEVDHIIEVESLSGWDGDWTGYIARLFCPASGLSIKCKPCHSKKSAVSNAARRKAKKDAGQL